MTSDWQKIQSALDHKSLETLLWRSVEQYSPSYAEEPAMQIFAERLSEAGLNYFRQPLKKQSQSPRSNLILELGPQPAALMWVGHVDTVPLIDEEEQRCHREGDLLYGLGTADMKSGCAAMVEAVIAIAQSGLELKQGLIVALVVGEEEYGDGSEALLDWKTAPLTVIGEPTNLEPCAAHYSYYESRLQAQGRRAHAALPEQGASAIHAMLVWLQHILETGSKLFKQGVSLNLREIRGGAELFMVAEACEAVLDIHAPADVPVEQLADLIEKARLQALKGHPRCTLQAEELYWAQGYAHEAGHPALQALRRAFEAQQLSWQNTAFRSHSDGSLFYQKGSIPIICGPGRLEVAHTRQECVSLEQVHTAAELYARMLYEICVLENEAKKYIK